MNNVTFEKRDIVEVAEELGIDLTYHDVTDRPYYTAFCPMHDNTRTPAFVIYPSVQRFFCYTCYSQGGDVIDLVRGVLGLTYKQALKHCTMDLTPEDTLLRSIRAHATNDADVTFLQTRAARIFREPRRIDFQVGQIILKRFDALLEQARWADADRLLRSIGL